MNRSPFIFAGLAVLAAGALAFPWISANHVKAATGSGHDMHAAHQDMTLPREGGQSAFAAIAEIVALLDADPDTDWSKVNISGLRDHLVDMNNLVLYATAEPSVKASGVSFRVTGEGDVVRAIHAMVPAHAIELNKIGPWTVETETTPDGAILTVNAKTPAELEKVKALGFFGLMALGSHHQPHHLAMAKGLMNH